MNKVENPMLSNSTPHIWIISVFSFSLFHKQFAMLLMFLRVELRIHKKPNKISKSIFKNLRSNFILFIDIMLTLQTDSTASHSDAIPWLLLKVYRVRKPKRRGPEFCTRKIKFYF